MKMSPIRSTSNDTGTYVSLHVNKDTKVHAARNSEGILVINLDATTIFFNEGSDVEMRNLLSHHTEKGTYITQREAMWLFDQVNYAKDFTSRRAELVERLRVAAGITED